MALTRLDRFEAKYIPEPNSGCWIWLGNQSKTSGYGYFRMSPNPDVRIEGAHRASWRLFHGEIPDGLCVCHKCDNRICVNPDHLFIGTHSENLRDAARKGRLSWTGKRNLPSGEKHHAAKLTWDDIANIRSSKLSAWHLSQAFGVSETQIYRIRSKQVWK